MWGIPGGAALVFKRGVCWGSVLLLVWSKALEMQVVLERPRLSPRGSALLLTGDSKCLGSLITDIKRGRSVSFGLGMLRVGCTARGVPLSSLCDAGRCVSHPTALCIVWKDDSPQGVPAPWGSVLALHVAAFWLCLPCLGLSKTQMPSGYLSGFR